MSTLSEASHGPASEAAATLAPSTRTSNRVSFPAAAGTRRTYLPSGPAATVASGGGAGSPRASRRAWSRGASQATAETVTPAAGRAPTRNRPRSSAAPAGLTMNATTEATMTKPVGTRTMSRPPPGPGLTPPSGVLGTAPAPEGTARHYVPARYRSRRQPSAGGYNAGLGADRPSRRGAQGEHGPLTPAGGGMAAGARVHRAGGGRLRGGERRDPGRGRGPARASRVRPTHLQELLRGRDPELGPPRGDPLGARHRRAARGRIAQAGVLSRRRRTRVAGGRRPDRAWRADRRGRA